MKGPKKPASPSRSRSPLERRVQFDPNVKDMNQPPEDAQPGLMRMKEARAAVPRKDGETRSQWKTRVFQNKRKMEEDAAKASSAKKK